LGFFKDLASENLELAMSRVIIDVVISVLGVSEFYNKCVRNVILHNAISTYWEVFEGYFHRRTISGKTEHTWIPSSELSVPPDADLIYGCPEVGSMQSSFNASIRREIFGDRGFIRFRLLDIASGHIHRR
jgi:hypothetical protein